MNPGHLPARDVPLSTEPQTSNRKRIHAEKETIWHNPADVREVEVNDNDGCASYKARRRVLSPAQVQRIAEINGQLAAIPGSLKEVDCRIQAIQDRIGKLESKGTTRKG